MKIKKLIYYFTSLLMIIINLENPWLLINFFRDEINKNLVLLRFRNGINLFCGDLMDLLVIKETVYDDCYKIKHHKNLKNLIIDIGAGIGEFSILAARKFPRAKIIAFEPNNKLFNVLLKNIKMNRLKNIKPYNTAVGREKKVYLYY